MCTPDSVKKNAGHADYNRFTGRHEVGIIKVKHWRKFTSMSTVIQGPKNLIHEHNEHMSRDKEKWLAVSVKRCCSPMERGNVHVCQSIGQATGQPTNLPTSQLNHYCWSLSLLFTYINPSKPLKTTIQYQPLETTNINPYKSNISSLYTSPLITKHCPFSIAQTLCSGPSWSSCP